MSSIRTVLNEERERLLKLRARYQKEIDSLPPGSVSIKTRNGKRYAYRSYRDSGKVRTEYIGPVESDKVAEVAALIDKRRDLKKLLKTANSRLAEVLRALK